jgi:hypothetical protein
MENKEATSQRIAQFSVHYAAVQRMIISDEGMDGSLPLR